MSRNFFISTRGSLRVLAPLALTLLSFFSFVSDTPTCPQEVQKTEVVVSHWPEERAAVYFHSGLYQTNETCISNYFIRYEVGNLSRYHNQLTKTKFDHSNRLNQRLRNPEILPIYRIFLNPEKDIEDPFIG